MKKKPDFTTLETAFHRINTTTIKVTASMDESVKPYRYNLFLDTAPLGLSLTLAEAVTALDTLYAYATR